MFLTKTKMVEEITGLHKWVRIDDELTKRLAIGRIHNCHLICISLNIAYI